MPNITDCPPSSLTTVKANDTALYWGQKIIRDLHDSGISAFSGAISGVCSAVLVCPLDVAKTKLQAQGSLIALQGSNAARKYSGIAGTLSTIVKEEGVRGLYRGVVPTTLGYFPSWAIYFTVYEEVGKALRQTPIAQYPFLSHMASATIAGASSTIATAPIWVVKTRLITQSPHDIAYKGMIDAICKMYSKEGIRAFYTGLGPSLLGLLNVAFYFPLYEHLKESMQIEETESTYEQAPKIFISSVAAKIFASTLTYPHELIRTRAQIVPLKSASPVGGAKYRGIVQTSKTILLEEGWRAFYSGLGINMVRTVPASALMLVSYEFACGYLKTARDGLRENASQSL